ncbi:MAG: Fe-S cluster assembly protein NifU [Spirochaetales bacterium]|nr:Fe-S cluster assembly protein NifU [Spirochaetales bacterium]
MWDYTDKVMDHYEHPRNVGEIENADAVGEVGSIACGDALKLTLKIKDGKIADAKFKTFGCGSAIASASALTEMIKGKTIEEVKKITNNDIVSFLGGLPKEKMHCSVMGAEALEEALAFYRGEKKVADPDNVGEVVCKCFNVTDQKIRRVALANNLHTVEEITNYTKAGGGCGLCVDQIQALLDDVWKNENTGKREHVKPKLSFLQKVKMIEKVINDEIRPILNRDGGDLELVDIQGNKVVVRLFGTCQGCHASQLTLSGLVEHKLKELVDDSLEVVEHEG